MGLPIDAKTDWQAVCNAEALLCSPKTLRNAFQFIVYLLGENGINAPKATLQPLNTKPRQWLEPEQIQKLIHLFACDQKAARISPGGSLYLSHDFFSMSISATIPGYCFFSSANLARAARSSFPGKVSVSVSTTVPSS